MTVEDVEGGVGVAIIVVSTGGCRMFARSVLSDPMQPLVIAMNAERTAGSA